MLKAHLGLTAQDIASRTHNISLLSARAGLSLSQHHQTILEETNEFSLSGRYPEQFLPLPSLSQAEKQMRRCEEGLSMVAETLDRAVVKQTIVNVVRKYLSAVTRQGIPIRFGVLFGSQATGNTHQWSDIDLVVVSPYFDGKRRFGDSAPLWHVATAIDTRIEPIGVGER